MSRSPSPAIVALDTVDTDGAARVAAAVGGRAAAVKLGLEFFAARGPEGVGAVARAGPPVFLDLKLHDIPNTVAGAVRALAPLRPFMLTVHAAGGRAMMRAAAEAAAAHERPPKVVGVTALTSLDAGDLAAAGVAGPVPDQVLRLAALAREAGLDGVVCSAAEAAAVRRETGPGFLIVVPGIRPAGAPAHDQKRTATPRDALAAGADYLVIGRAVTGAPDPAAALERMLGDAG